MPNWFAELAGETFAPLLWVVFVAASVCALAVVVLLLARRTQAGGSLLSVARVQRPRLAVVETIGIGERRRLVLVRHDDKEHLLMLGGHTDLVVASGLSGPERSGADETAGSPAPALQGATGMGTARTA
ncbi:hypothetical protein DYI37_16205 [Fulvimarina endophytica]|uniref:Flagellar assembly protein FliO n=1 Tax=Fulvimarina endophytica TaxID=2293836 RepID=A0A371WZI6_9HYPH|nr:flagellar biosynthetic protein FliO [Fulvimarina endophytica]RFC62372.1 hypothetical protein DYI37_16205 [Fulvimarina endophytica]